VIIAVWIAQALLALAFILGGFMKATRPIEQLRPMMPWTSAVPVGLVRFNGVAEFLGGGRPGGASAHRYPAMAHACGRGRIGGDSAPGDRLPHPSTEYPALPVNLVLGALMAFVAYGRVALVPV